jgi:hypothetical protein
VQIVIDEKGNVISATAISGHPLLRAAAVAAAQQSKFAPTLLSGSPVKITGVVVYNFTTQTPTANVVSATTNSEAVNDVEQAAPPLTPEMIRRKQFEGKIHPKIAALLDYPGKSLELSFVRDGKAEIVVRFSSSLTPEIIKELQNLGFEISRELPNFKVIAGRISVDKLSALAELTSVKFIAPAVASN